MMGAPFFSPDGAWMGFINDSVGTLSKMPMRGGANIRLLDWESFGGATWGANDKIYYVPSLPGGIVKVDPDGSNALEILKPDVEGGERLFKHPCILPSGKTLLFTVAMKDSETFDDTRIVALNLKTGQKKVLIEGGMYARYSPSGHLIYARNGSLYAAPLDEKALALKASPLPVLNGVLMSTSTGQAYYNLSSNGDLAYAPGPVEGGKRSLVWVDRSGREEPLELPQRSYLHPRISPDNRRLAVEVEGANHDWYIHDFERGVLTKVSTDGLSHWPSWSPDGKSITFRSGIMGRFSMQVMPSDRSAGPVSLSREKPADAFQNPVGWSPDGKYLTFEQGAPGKGVDIYALAVGTGAKPLLISNGKYNEGSPKFSPDGSWVAFCTNESKRAEVYVQPFPGPGPKIQISSEGGTDPIWSRGGRELFYRDGDKLMAVDVALKPAFRAGKPHMLWSGHYSHGMSSSCGPPGISSSNYDVSSDGNRFLMVKDAMQDAVSRNIVVVMGWSEDLKRILATAKQ
jgi:serine/threonine-protein kinase